jgi:hypothetical protein
MDTEDNWKETMQCWLSRLKKNSTNKLQSATEEHLNFFQAFPTK